MIGLVRAAALCATLALGLVTAQAADKAFKRDDLADSAIKLEAQIARQNIKTLRGKVVQGEALPARVVIRADRDTPFAPIFAMIKTCQTNGYEKFDLKAMNGP